MDRLRLIEELVAFEGRGPGTDAERRASQHLAGRLREMGREAEVEPISVRPNFPLVHVVHAVLAIGGSVLSVSQPLAGTLLVLLAAVSTFGDLTGSFHLVRRVTARRASQNVVSAEDGGKPGALVLVAHYDSGRTAGIFKRRSQERRARIGRLIRRPLGPWEPFFWAIAVALVCSALRIAEIDALSLTIVQFVATVALILSVPLIADIGLSGIMPGASDNASGVATVLELAERYGGRLENFDLWVLLPGAKEGLMLGMREWMRSHRRDLDPASTVFVGVDDVGGGRAHYARKEGWLFALRYHPTVVALCEDTDAPAVATHTASDVHLARARGFPAVAVSCLDDLGLSPNYHQPTDTPERIDPEALDDALDLCCELIESIDERIGPDLWR